MFPNKRTLAFAGSLLLLVALIVVPAIVLHSQSSHPTKAVPGAPNDAPAAPAAFPAIIVEASYPGADARVVADTVAAPIEEQVNGVEGMLHMVSESGNDGTYKLTVTFRPGFDLDMAEVLVKNRATLALPVLPALVQNEGVTYKKKSPGLAMIVTLTSPDGKFDRIYLSNYALIQIKDELALTAGVGDIVFAGPQGSRWNIIPQPEKLAAHGLSVVDVVNVLSKEDLRIGPLPNPNEKPELKVRLPAGPITTRLAVAERLGNIVLKTDDQGVIVRVRDVAGVEMGTSPDSVAQLNGQPAAVLCIYPMADAKPRDLGDAVAETVAVLRRRLPDGLALDVGFDFTPTLVAHDQPAPFDYLLLDVVLPDSASLDRYVETLRRCEETLRKIDGVQNLLTMTENPFDQDRHRKCILVRLAPAGKRDATRQDVAQTIRTELTKQVPEMMLRVRDLSGQNRMPACAFPIHAAILDTGNLGEAALQRAADQLVRELNKSGRVTDLWVNSAARSVPQLHLDIDREKAAALGVSLTNINNTLQVFLGFCYVNNFNQFGRTWQLNVQVPDEFRKRADNLQRIQVASAEGKMVPLGAIAKIRMVSGATTIERVNCYRAVTITGNPALGVSPAEIRSLGDALAENTLPKGFRLTWLEDTPPD